MNNKPFLQQVAEYVIEQPDLENHCFVFPSRRACTYFKHELKKALREKVILLPHITTILDFASTLLKAQPIAPIEALFTLYECYRDIGGNEDYEFDRFVKWGNIILHDFNDVDMAMADAKQLFLNISQYREISTDYLDEELKRKLEKYFNLSFASAEPVLNDDGEPSFWRHYSGKDNDSNVKKNYLKLWQQLYDLYTAYRLNLQERGLTYTGRIYRDAAIYLKNCGAEELPWAKIGFVGFSMLTTSEMVMFNALEKKGVANFFWDKASPFFNLSWKNNGNEGAKYINSYSKMFPMPNDFVLDTIEELPQIKFVSVPSNIGQAKVAFDLLSNLNEDKLNSKKTAIVIPDEALFIPLLNSIPESVKSPNITMGYTLKYSEISSLLKIIAISHRRSRRNKDNPNKWEYLREDVKDALSHPLIKKYFGTQALRIIAKIDNENLFYVPDDLFLNTSIEVLFNNIDSKSTQQEVEQYIHRLSIFLSTLQESIETRQAENPVNENESENNENNILPLQAAFISKTVESLEYIIAAIQRHGVPVTDNSILYLLDRLTSSQTIPLEGKPLQGLQIMGMLETRCIDFDNIVILSVNERVLPGKYRPQSFISESLRSIFNLPTARKNEAMWSYHFYRLISRTQTVNLAYDSRVSPSVGSNEPSRFIEQLRLLYKQPLNLNLTKIQYSSRPSVVESPNLQGLKSPYVINCLNQFLNPNSKKYLSASSINCFIDCPMKFYLKYIEKLGDENQTTDFMQATTFGTIVHEALQELYYPNLSDGRQREGSYIVSKDMIKDFEKNKLDDTITRLVNRHYLNLPKDRWTTPLFGEAAINSISIKTFVKRALDFDYNQMEENDTTTIEVIECEKDHIAHFPIDNGQEFNFTFKADRIDRISGTNNIRIIDYKTGQDATRFKDIDELFNEQKYFERPHAALQILLYCYAFAQDEKYKNSIITPMIYKLRNMSESGLFQSNKPITDYHEVNNFLETFTNKISKLFNPDIPFNQLKQIKKQNSSDNNSSYNTTTCDYCPFIDICSR